VTDPFDRASRRARSLVRVLLGGLFATLGLIAGGCGNSTITYGTVVTTFSSDPGPFAAYIVDLYSFDLVLSNGNTGYRYSGALGAGKTVDFAQLADTTELFGSLAVAEGTYTSATVTFNYSGGVSSNYFPAQLFLDINGTSTQATLYDPTSTASPPATPGIMTYTIKLDPNRPLVVKRGTPVQLEFHFDTNASSLIDTTVTPPTVLVRPFLTASTQPATTKRLRARGEFVVADEHNSYLTMNMQPFFDAPSYQTLAQGAVKVHTTDKTTYNINGAAYQGAAGLAAVATLREKITTIMAYGTLGDISGLDPIFEATEVYAGSAIEDPVAARATGTIVSNSTGTVHLHNAEITFPRTAYGTAADVVQFQNDVPLTVSARTGVAIDQQPYVPSGIQSMSIGQQVDVEAPNYTLPSDSASASLDASAGLVRLTSTSAWGNLKSAMPGTAVVSLLTLGDTAPADMTFTGTGAATAEDADPTSYVVGTGSVDLSAYTANSPLFRFDGIVSAYGSAAPTQGTPHFIASVVTANSSSVQGFPKIAEQVLTLQWKLPGVTSPFSTINPTELVPNMEQLSAAPRVRTGPSNIDLASPAITPIIVPDSTVTGAFSVGNGTPGTTTGIITYQDFSEFVSHIIGVTDGANTFVQMAAVGHYDEARHTFTAYRIDMVYLP
jgi:hypothetical protein